MRIYGPRVGGSIPPLATTHTQLRQKMNFEVINRHLAKNYFNFVSAENYFISNVPI